MFKYYAKEFLRWLCDKLELQCSGKYRDGHGKIWCQKNAFHEDVCVDYSGKEFTMKRPEE